MFRATVSPIFRSTFYIQLFVTMYRLCCLLPTDDTDWMELLLVADIIVLEMHGHTNVNIL